MKFSIGQSCIHRAFASSQCKHLDHAACSPLRSFSARLDPVSARRASELGFVAQPSNPDGFAKIVENPAYEPKSIILAFEEKFRYQISYGKA
jgi:hypothetical protein